VVTKIRFTIVADGPVCKPIPPRGASGNGSNLRGIDVKSGASVVSASPQMPVTALGDLRQAVKEADGDSR
jgi:hypothetical protein